MNQEEVMKQLQRGMQELRAGSLDVAENIFRSILSQDALEIHSLHFLGVIFCQKGNLDDGVALIEKSIHLNPSRFVPYLNLGRFLIAASQWDRAVNALSEAVQRDASSFDAWAMLARSSYFAGDIDVALMAGRKAAEINPGNAEIYFSLGIYSTEKNKDEAIDNYCRAVTIDPTSFKSWANMGNLLLDCQRVGESINAFQEALKIDPACFQAFLGLSRAYGDLDKWLESLDVAKQALALEPSSLDAAFWVAFSFHKLDHKQDAVNAYEYLLSLEDGKTSRNFLYTGSAYEGLGNEDKALLCYAYALDLDNANEEACLFQGAILSRRHDDNSALKLYKSFLCNQSESVRVLTAIGSLFLGQKKLVEARNYLQKSLKLRKVSAAALAGIAEIDRRENKFESSVTGY